MLIRNTKAKQRPSSTSSQSSQPTSECQRMLLCTYIALNTLKMDMNHMIDTLWKKFHLYTLPVYPLRFVNN